MTTVTIATLGCKVNQFESEALLSSFEGGGYRLIPFGEPADITIINTCTVTHRADFQSRQIVRRALRANPDSLLIVTGCYAQVHPEALAKIEGVRYVLGNQEKNRLLEILPLLERGDFPRIQAGDISKENFFSEMPLHSFHHHTRAFLKIQDGCNRACSYCIVPRARGPSRSLPLDRILGHLRSLREKGFKEVVLTGIHIGTYGLDLNPSLTLERLLQELETAQTPGRIRLSSVEPGDFSEPLISSLSQSTKVCPHLHIPIQSGEDEILRKMSRDYDAGFLGTLITDLDRRIPGLCLGADVIAGFPGETEEKFEQTLQLIETLPLSYLHVFPFSRRKGTPASEFSPQVREATIKERAEKLRALGKKKRQAFYQMFLGREVSVLVEDRRDKRTGMWKGFSRNYIPILVSSPCPSGDHHDWINQELSVRIVEVKEEGVMGEVTERKHG
jgi:threonylcarbamoyladenosine tRNA methylthiotransferase MtaB